MIPRSASYANRFKSADREHVEQLKQAYTEERADILARSRRLQQETNRRRKALTVKRKVEAAKEEKRRQEILNRRREQQHEATERFQRLGKPREQLIVDYQYKHPSKPSPALEEALRTVSGRPSHFVRQNSRETPVLEDALQAVRGSPNNARNGYMRQNSAGRRNTENGLQYKSDRPLSGSFRDRPPSGSKRDRPGSGKMYSQSTMGPNRIQEHAREVAARADLQTHSLRQMSNSRSLFEQQIEQQQSFLLEQQKQSLHHFNTAIQKEMDRDAKLLGTEQEEIIDPEKEMNGKIVRSDSLSSVDSLEMSSGLTRDSLMSSAISTSRGATTAGNYSSNAGSPGQIAPQTTKMNTHSSRTNSAWGTSPSVTGFNLPESKSAITNGIYTGTNTSSVAGGFVLHRSPSNPTNVAVVSPSVVHARNETRDPDMNGKPSLVQGNLDIGYFTPSKDSRSKPSIAGPDSYSKDDGTKNDVSSTMYTNKSEPYDVIKTSSNGRANAHYYQDSVVNNANTFVLHPHPDLQEQFNSDLKQAPQSGFGYTDPHSSKSSATTATVTSNYTSSSYIKNHLTTPQYSPANYTDSSTKAVTASASVVAPTTIPSGLSHMAYLPHPPNSSAPSNRPAVTMADMRASSFAGNVNAKKYEPMSVTEELNQLYDDDEVVEEEEQPKVERQKHKTIKGILKKPKQPTAVGRGMSRGVRAHSATTYTAKLRAQGRGRGAAVLNTEGPSPAAGGGRPSSSSSSVRDSIEVARDQLSARKHTPLVKKRSIRWADMTYSDDEDVEDEEIVKEIKDVTNQTIQKKQHRQEPIINTQTKIPTASSSPQKPRPFSAKFSTNTQKVESSARATSAGPRRQPFIRPSLRNSLAANRAQAAENSKNVSLNNWESRPAMTNSTVHPYNSGNVPSATYHGSSVKPSVPQTNRYQPNQDKLSSSVTAADIRKSLEGAVYDSNGIRLDRTPTDDEINWLWDKVRTCLSRQSTVESNAGDNYSERSESASIQPRQTAQVSNKYIDGTTLGPQLRTSTRMFANYNGNSTTNDNLTHPKKKISMDTLNTYNRRATSGTQKRSPSINNGYIHNHGALNQPAQSHFGPNQSPSMPVVNEYGEAVSESMAEFLTAEEMSTAKSGSITDSQLHTAMQQRMPYYNTANQGQRKVLSALSLEEQKLLQSLEMLNERLKVIEDHEPGIKSDSTPAVYVPRPPQHRPGFRGHNPISQQRRYSSNAGTVNRHRYRTGSARLAARAASSRYQ